MSYTYVGDLNIPNYTFLSTDIVGNAVVGVTREGAVCLATDTGTWYIVKSDLTLASYGLSIGKASTSTFSATDNLTRPANSTPYAANKSINCDLTVTGIAYTLLAVTLTVGSGHGLVATDRITVNGVNSGASVSNVDGNWVISTVDSTHITFNVLVQPTGITPQTGLTITHTVAKMLSVDVAAGVGQGVILSRISVSLPGIGMTGAIRAYIYTQQTTVLYDQANFTLLTANDTYRRDYFDLYPVTESAGSDVCFASQRLWEVFKCDPADTRLYFRLVAEGAGTPTTSGVVTVRVNGIQLLG
jgi:hypothetical protein